MANQFTVEELGKRVKQRSGGKLDGFSDAEVGQRVYSRSPEQFKGLIVEPETTTRKPRLLENLGAKLKERVATALEGVGAMNRGEQGGLRTFVQAEGQAAGFVNDLLSEAAGGAFRLLPNAIETPIRQAASDTIKAAVNTAPGRAVVRGGQAAANLYDREVAQKYPGLDRDVRAVANIASLIPVGKGAKVASEAGEQALRFGDDLSRAAGAATKNAIRTVDEVTSPIAQGAKRGFVRRIENIKTNRQAAKAKEVIEAELPETARKAVQSGVDIRDANFVANASTMVKERGREMIKKAKELVAGGKADPADVVGQEFLSKYKVVDAARKKAGKTLTKYAKQIPASRLKNVNTQILNKLKGIPGLENIKMRITRNGWDLDFRKTNLSRNKTAQSDIISALRDATKRDGQGLHRLRQELFDELNLKSSTRVKQVETLEDKALNGIRQALSDVLDASNDQYKALNSNYAFYENSLKGFRNKLKAVDGADEDILSMRLSEIARRLTSNASSDAQNILRQLEQAAQKAGVKNTVDIVDLQEMLNIVDSYYDIAKKTGFKKQSAEAIRTAIPSKRDLINKAGEYLLEKTADFRQSDAVRQKALETMLEMLEEAPKRLRGSVEVIPAAQRIRVRAQ